MRIIPNAITFARMISSVLLLFVEPFTTSFMAIYLFCGISDVMDGFIARRYQLTSSFGATLDSIADCFFVFIALYVILPVVLLPSWALVWIGGIALLKIGSLMIGTFRYKALAFLHTYLNKITGGMLFGFPILYSYFGMKVTSVVLCSVATVAAIEELAINIIQKELQRDRKSFL